MVAMLAGAPLNRGHRVDLLLNGDGTYPRMWEDLRSARTGGFGIDDKWFGDGQTNGWRETNVRFEGPAVRQLEGAFAAAWAEATDVLFTGRLTSASHEGGVAAGLLYTTPTLGSTAAERFLALSIAAARKTLYITNPYFVPDTNSSRCWRPRPREASMCGSSRLVRRPTCPSSGGPDAELMTCCWMLAYAFMNGSRPGCMRRRLSSMANGLSE
jgi:hypothetical protein